MVNLYEFLSHKKILHSEEANDGISGHIFLITNENIADIITFKFNDCPKINDCPKNNEGLYVYDYNVKRIGEIVDNINVKIKSNSKFYITYIIGEYTSDKFKEFICLLAPFQNFKIRITFLEKPMQNDEIIISLRYYMLDTESSDELLKYQCVRSDSGLYYNGIYYNTAHIE